MLEKRYVTLTDVPPASMTRELEIRVAGSVTIDIHAGRVKKIA